MSTLLDRQKEFTKHLVAGMPELNIKGLPLVSACAVTGNATQESLVRAVTGPVDHGSDGTLQWRLTRLDGPVGLRGWSAAQGIKWDTLRAQAAFFLWELHKDYPALEKDLRDAKKPIETLTANICVFYERPNMAVAHLDLRISHAKSVYQIMRGSLPIVLTPVPAPAPVPVPAPAEQGILDRILDAIGKLPVPEPTPIPAPMPEPPAPIPEPVPAPPPVILPPPPVTAPEGIPMTTTIIQEIRAAMAATSAETIKKLSDLAELQHAELTQLRADLAAAKSATEAQQAELAAIKAELVTSAKAKPAASPT